MNKEKCIPNPAVDKYCPMCDDEGTCEPAFDWRLLGNRNYQNLPPMKEIDTIIGYELATLEFIKQLAYTYRVISVRPIQHTLDRNVRHVSHYGHTIIPVKSDYSLYM